MSVTPMATDFYPNLDPDPWHRHLWITGDVAGEDVRDNIVIKGDDQKITVTRTAPDGTQTAQTYPAEVGFRWGVVHVRLGKGDDFFRNDSALPCVAAGGAGNDTLIGGQQDDLLYGGDDKYYVNDFDPSDGRDYLEGRGGNDRILGGPDNDTIYGGTDADRIDGEDGNDVLYGGSENDTLDGGKGIDTLYGESGDDLLNGTNIPTTDTLDGGAGHDTLTNGKVNIPGPASVIQFKNSTVRVVEGNLLTVEVECRPQDIDVDSSVQWTLENAPAGILGNPSNGIGSSTGTGTLKFTQGQEVATAKLQFQLADDNVDKGDRIFTIRLFNPTNATLAQDTIQITVQDNDGLVPPPIALGDQFSMRVGEWRDFLVLGNDTDGRGGKDLIITSTQKGSVSSDGKFISFHAGSTGTDTFAYAIQDTKTGRTATGMITVEVAEAPRTVVDAKDTRQGQTVTIDVLSNDPGFTAIEEVSTLPRHGTTRIVQISGRPAIEYAPSTAFFGDDELEYVASYVDSSGTHRSQPTKVSIHVTQVDVIVPPPGDATAADQAKTFQNRSVTIDVLSNDRGCYQLDSIVTAPRHGTARIVPDPANPANSKIEYTPATGFFGDDELEYVALYTDRSGKQVSQPTKVTIRVLAVPAAVDDRLDVKAGAKVRINVAKNDQNWNSASTFQAAIVQEPKHGTVRCFGAAFQYQAEPGFHGLDSFTYRWQDGSETGNVAKVVLVVGNHKPTAVNDSATTWQGQSVKIRVLKNDKDSDGDKLAVAILTPVANGRLEPVSSDQPNVLTYTPNPGFFGEDRFTYSVTDPFGKSATATAVIKVRQNSAPLAAPDQASVKSGKSVEIRVKANDSDPDKDALQVERFEHSTANGGTVKRKEGFPNVLVYTAARKFVGTDTFEYTVTDSHGGLSKGTVTVTVRAAAGKASASTEAVRTSMLIDTLDVSRRQDAIPVILSPGLAAAADCLVSRPVLDSTLVSTDTVVSTQPFGPDCEICLLPDLDPASAFSGDPTANRDIYSFYTGQKSSLDVLANDTDSLGGGNLRIIATQNGRISADGQRIDYVAPSDSGCEIFEYVVQDVNTGRFAITTVSIQIDRPSPPTANDDQFDVISGQIVQLNVLANDFDGRGGTDLLIVNTDDLPGLHISPDGQYIEYSAPALDGATAVADVFQYVIKDTQSGRIALGRVELVVRSNQDADAPPEANDDALDADAGQLDVVLDVLANDLDGRGGRELEIVDADGYEISEDGKYILYTASEESGMDEFTYTVADTVTGLESTSTVSVTIHAAKGPEANADALDADAGQLDVVLDVLANDLDGRGGHELEIVDADGYEISEDGKYILYTAPEESGMDEFTYTILDTVTGLESTATVTVHVHGPTARDDSFQARLGRQITLDVLSNDSDTMGGPGLEIDDVDCGNAWVSDDGKSIIYEAPEEGTEDYFSYTIRDTRTGGFAEAHVAIQLLGNRVPDARDDSVNTMANNSVEIPVRQNDTDPDGDELKVVDFQKHTAKGGTIQAKDGHPNVLIYTPAADFAGADSFSYTIDDGYGGRDAATVSILIQGSQRPHAVDDNARARMNEPKEIDKLLDNDWDPDGDKLNIVKWTDSAHGGTVRPKPNHPNVLIYAPPANYVGEDTFTYTIGDGKGGRDAATVYVKVGNRNPIAVNDRVTVPKNGSVEIRVRANDSDPDGDELNVVNYQKATAKGGTIQPKPDHPNVLVYTPKKGFVGLDSFTYTVADGRGGLATGTVEVEVTASARATASLVSVMKTPDSGASTEVDWTSAVDTLFRSLPSLDDLVFEARMTI